MKISRVRRKRTVNQDSSSKGFFSNGPGIQEKQRPFFSQVSPKSEEDAAKSVYRKTDEKKDEVKTKLFKQEKEEDKNQVKKKEEEKEQDKAVQKQTDDKEKTGQKVQGKGMEEDKDAGKIKTKADEEKEGVKMKEASPDEKKDEKINAKFNDDKTSAEFETALKRTKGGGTPLPDKLRKEVENIYKTPLGNVRIHTGQEAAHLCNKINAQAFTHGSDIYFNEGKYNPDTTQGKHLLIHELTHVVQQGGDEESTT